MAIDLGSELRRFANTCRWSLDGWRAAWATEKSLRQWTFANGLSAALRPGIGLPPPAQAVMRVAARPKVTARRVGCIGSAFCPATLWPQTYPKYGQGQTFRAIGGTAQPIRITSQATPAAIAVRATPAEPQSLARPARGSLSVEM